MNDNMHPRKDAATSGVTRRQFARRAAILAGGASLPAFGRPQMRPTR